jgi:MSHA biogenesis protein MshO
MTYLTQATANTRASAKGFTLVELVTVIIVLGVVSIGISGFIRSGVQIYADVTERDQLLSESHFVVERINRELRLAVPNSIRVLANSANTIQCIEFLPAAWATYYTRLSMMSAPTSTANVVDFAFNAANFILNTDEDFAIVYPTSNNDVYDLSHNRRKAIEGCTVNGSSNCNEFPATNGIAELTFSSDFEALSPASRLYITRSSVSYCAHASGEIYRNEDSINTTQIVYTSGTLMANNLNNDFTNTDEAPFQVFDATLTRNGLVYILLTFELNEEIIHYSGEVHIPNVP